MKKNPNYYKIMANYIKALFKRNIKKAQIDMELLQIVSRSRIIMFVYPVTLDVCIVDSTPKAV